MKNIEQVRTTEMSCVEAASARVIEGRVELGLAILASSEGDLLVRFRGASDSPEFRRRISALLCPQRLYSQDLKSNRWILMEE